MYLCPGEKFEPGGYKYETIGGNNSRTALQQIVVEYPELATEPYYYSSGTVRVYRDLSAQYLAINTIESVILPTP